MLLIVVKLRDTDINLQAIAIKNATAEFSTIAFFIMRLFKQELLLIKSMEIGNIVGYPNNN